MQLIRFLPLKCSTERLQLSPNLASFAPWSKALGVKFGLREINTPQGELSFIRSSPHRAKTPRPQRNIFSYFFELGVLCAFARVIVYPIFSSSRQDRKEKNFPISPNLASFAPLQLAPWNTDSTKIELVARSAIPQGSPRGIAHRQKIYRFRR